MLKLIKHCEEDSGGPELVQGVLLGLVVGETLEITNCFPFPRTSENSDFDEGELVRQMSFMVGCFLGNELTYPVILKDFAPLGNLRIFYYSRTLL